LSEYYRIKGGKLKEATKELYLFLLGDQTLLEQWQKQPMKLLWG
jgi:hypothetical protein